MSKKFFKIRMALLVIGLVVMGYMLATTTGIFSWLDSEPEYGPYLAEGTPIVEAVHRFKAERGLWPQYLDDLAPAYLAKTPNARWIYKVDRSGPSLAHPLVGVARTWVGYDFDAVKPTWKVFGEVYNRDIKTVAAVRVASTQSAEEQRAATVREYERRIRREPTDMTHRRAYASWLLAGGQRDAARTVIEKAGEDQPMHFWPRMALAQLELEAVPTTSTAPAATAPATQPTGAFAEFLSWVNANPAFTHQYYVFNLWQERDAAQAVMAIEAALAHPLELGKDDFQRLDFYCYDMARYLLKEKQYALVMKLCDAWQAAQDGGQTSRDESSFLALRAAAYVAEGEFAKAEADMRMLDARRGEPWARDLAGLRKAIGAKDRAFVYVPGGPETFRVFAVGE